MEKSYQETKNTLQEAEVFSLGFGFVQLTDSTIEISPIIDNWTKSIAWYSGTFNRMQYA